MSLLGCPSLKSAWACSWGLVGVYGDDISTLTCRPIYLSIYLDLLYLSIHIYVLPFKQLLHSSHRWLLLSCSSEPFPAKHNSSGAHESHVK